MTEQIRVQPPVFEVAKHFGPFMATVELPEEVIVNLTKMTDDLLKIQIHQIMVKILLVLSIMKN